MPKAAPLTVYDIWKPVEHRPLRQLPRLIAESVRLLWVAGRREFITVSIVQVLSGAAGGVQLILVKNLLDAITAAGQSRDFSLVVPWLTAIAALTLLTTFSGAVQWELQRLLSELVNRRATLRIFDVTAVADLKTFETPDFHNRLERAWMSSGARPMQTTQSLMGLMSAIAGVLGVVIALFAVLPILVPLLLLGAIPVLLIAARSSKALHEFDFWLTPLDRRRQYVSRVMTHREHAHEVIAFDLAGFLRQRWTTLHDERLLQLRRLVRMRINLAVLVSFGNTLLFLVPVSLVSYLLVSGSLDFSQAVAAATGILVLRPNLQGLIWSASQLYECALFLDDYNSFLDLRADLLAEAHRAGGQQPLPFSRLDLEHISFTYPTGDEPALEDVSLSIEAGQIVALVGENGSGKTTLAKLLCGLYPASAGRLLWDDTDANDLDLDDRRRLVAVLFQDFCHYFFNVQENIGVGRHERLDDQPAVISAAERAGADEFIRDLPERYDTVLGPEFEGGHNLSVGQWQRVALARAFLRDAPFIILDEPTAALDARAEHALFDSIRTLFRGRTVLLISHRFSSVRSADLIYVLHKGRLIEQGTHDSLMARGGQYAELFSLQAAAYQLEERSVAS